jgi:hypothetical protein
MISAGLQAWVGQKSPDVKAPTPLHRALQYLHSVIKELVTVKMPSGIKATGQVGSSIWVTSPLINHVGS